MKNLPYLSSTRFCLACAIGIALMLTGCGGGSPTPIVKLVGVSISPTSVSIPVGFTVGLNAIGTYSNGKTAYITNQVTWISASSPVATVGINTGVVTGVSAGSGVPATTTITPTLSGWTLPVVNITVSSTGGVTSSTGLITARFDHTATLLASGSSVLVTGGYGAGATLNALNSTELYDTGSGTWASASSVLNIARGDHTATLLANGQVLVAGGVDSKQIGVPSAELYDPNTGVWTATSSLNTTRSYHTATLLVNGKVLLVGGANTTGVLNSAEIYDPATATSAGKWAPAGTFTTQRYSHTATLLQDGTVLVVGGFDGIGTALASVELFNTTGSGSWTQLSGRLTTGRYSHTATLLNDGTVLVAGGSDSAGNDLASAELYDPTTKTWTQVGSLGTPRYNHTATFLSADSLHPNGQVQVMGGTNVNNYNLASVELYTPPASGVQGTWVATHDLLVGRVTHTATLLTASPNNGKVLVVGGDAILATNVTGPISDVELYW